MKVGIAGAGAVALGYAAFLIENGHSPNVWSPSGESTRFLADGGRLTVLGAVAGEFRPALCHSSEELAKSDVIVLALPANGHRLVIDSLVPHIDSRHVIIISGHLSFAALYLARKLAERRVHVPIVAWSTTVLTSKAQGPGLFRVGAIRSNVDMAVVPGRFAEAGHSTCRDLFGDRFSLKDDLLTIALSNLNPQVHLGIALCNLTRIEHGETWGQNSNLTPTVGRLIEALDRERLEIARAYGKEVSTISVHYESSFGVVGETLADTCRILAEKGTDPLGPKEATTRYVFEDVPFGLVATLRLACLAGAPAPLHQCGVDILGACYGRDFRMDDDLSPGLEIGDLCKLKELVVEGYP